MGILHIKLFAKTLKRESLWNNGQSAGLQPRSKRVLAPFVLFTFEQILLRNTQILPAKGEAVSLLFFSKDGCH